MSQKTFKLGLKKSTKGTHVYDAVDDDAPIKSVYVAKKSLPEQAPKHIKLTLES